MPTKIKALEREAKRIGFNMSKVCKAAGVARSTLWRGVDGAHDTRDSTFDKLRDGLIKLAKVRCAELTKWLDSNK